MGEARFKSAGCVAALVALLLVMALAFTPISAAVAEQEGSALATGEADNASKQWISVTYGAIDKVRYPSKFGGYPLPSPDDPLSVREEVSSIPPSQKDIDRFYREFDDYELLHAYFDYSSNTLNYVYFWRYGTSREEAEAQCQEDMSELLSRDEVLEQERYAEEVNRLTEVGDMEAVEKLENERIGYEPQPEHLEPSVSQEEMIAASLADTERNLAAARARGNAQEIAQLERERAQKQAELAQERAANAQGDTDEVGEANSEGAVLPVVAVVGVALGAVIAALLVARFLRGRSRN